MDPVILERIFESALRAPSAHNRQPWRWMVLQDGADKQRLAEAMGHDLIEARTLDGHAPEAIEEDYHRSVNRITQAPVVIVACVDMTEMDIYPDPERKQSEYLMAVQSVAMAGQNIMLLAHSEGLGTCWMCAPLFSPASVHAALDLNPDWNPQGLILLGHPLAPGRERSRKPLEEVVRWIGR